MLIRRGFKKMILQAVDLGFSFFMDMRWWVGNQNYTRIFACRQPKPNTFVQRKLQKKQSGWVSSYQKSTKNALIFCRSNFLRTILLASRWLRIPSYLAAINTWDASWPICVNKWVKESSVWNTFRQSNNWLIFLRKICLHLHSNISATACSILELKSHMACAERGC